MKAFKKMTLAVMLVGLGVMVGCSKESTAPLGDDNQPQQTNPSLQISTDPVTLKFASHFVDEEFQRIFVEPVKKKYPHITLELLPGQLADVQKYVNAGEIPDIVMTYNGALMDFYKWGFMEDASALLKRHQVDLDRFNENYLIDIQSAVSGHEALYGVPMESAFHAMYYNKDIFQRFGVPFPTDGMTWADTIELSKRVTRMDDGVQYRGFDPNSVLRVAQPLGLPYIDPKTEKSVLGSEPGWRKAFELTKQILTTPSGNAPAGQPSGRGGFLKNKTIAMFIDVNMLTALPDAEKNGLNWDVVQHPSYPEYPNVFGNGSVYVPMISGLSKYKDQAMQVVLALVSDEVQLGLSKAGRVSSLKSREVQNAFGADNPVLQGKNVRGIVKSVPVKYPLYLHRDKAEKIIRTKFDDYLKGNVDVNTALLQADEELNKVVEEEKQK